MPYKEKFIELFNTHITRPGAEDLLEWICTTDFFTAPASTRYHGSFKGGLVEHSLNVYSRLSEIGENYSDASIAVCALLHDICKANFYTTDMRNAKNEQGVWVKVPYYTVKDQFPMGHGEKSLYLVSRYIELTDEEALAIRWHMGAFDQAVKGGSPGFSDAANMYPLVLDLHTADMRASHWDECPERQSL